MQTQLLEQALPITFIVVVTLIFMVLERIRPGRELPHVRGWYIASRAYEHHADSINWCRWSNLEQIFSGKTRY